MPLPGPFWKGLAAGRVRQPPSPDSVLRKPGEPPSSRRSDRNAALPNPCLSPRRSPCLLCRGCWFVFTAPFESKSQCGRLPLSSLRCLSWAEDSLRNGSVTTRPWPVTSTHAAQGPDVACSLWAQPGLPRVLVCPLPPSCPRPAPALWAHSVTLSQSLPLRHLAASSPLWRACWKGPPPVTWPCPVSFTSAQMRFKSTTGWLSFSLPRRRHPLSLVWSQGILVML